MPKKFILALCALLALAATPALADDHRGSRGHYWQEARDDDDRRWGHKAYGKHHKHKKHHKARRHGDRITWHGERRWRPAGGHHPHRPEATRLPVKHPVESSWEPSVVEALERCQGRLWRPESL